MPFLIGILLAFVVAPASAQAPAVAPPVIVGAVVSETGILAGLAADYRRALILWHEELNRAGGLLERRVALRLLDDGSDAKRSGELYAQLIREKADLLIGPFGSAATLTASAQAESARRVLINGAGPSLASGSLSGTFGKVSLTLSVQFRRNATSPPKPRTKARVSLTLH